MRRWALILLLASAVALIVIFSGEKPRMAVSEGVYDSDGDGWSDGYEIYLGTSPLTACLRDDVDPNVRGWPADFDNNGTVDIFDLTDIAGWFGYEVSYYYSWQLRRFDIYDEPMGDGTIDIFDLIRVAGLFGNNCVG